MNRLAETGILFGRFAEREEVPLLNPAQGVASHFKKLGDMDLIVVRREDISGRGQEVREGSLGVDREVVDHWVHRKGQRLFQPSFFMEHDLAELLLGFRLAMRGEDEPHSSPGHAAEHPESPKV
ncbi:MAG: hypothetical protein AAF311_10935, partial [Pseudomonadota bacterium]